MKVRFTLVFPTALMLIACGDPPEPKGKICTEQEQYEIIREGLIPHFDTLSVRRTFLNRFAILHDTAYALALIREFERKQINSLSYSEPEELPPFYRPDFETNELDTAFLRGLNFISQEQWDSIHKNNQEIRHGNYSLEAKNVYSISRPFRPDTSEIAVVEVYPVEVYLTCFPLRNKYILLKKEHGKWVVRRDL